ncbi:hypothetical protein Barb4_03036 [Bacteroidales bacterium Barb4]|nr:hypothetical protein Barb4_03036 [Bacteroidales bacterium Barb4]
MSNLQNKSEILIDAAKLLHDKNWYPAVAHGAYYCCYQLSKHIWLHKMGKSQQDLDRLCNASKSGSHEVLINEVRNYIRESNKANCDSHMRDYNSQILQLKKLRVKADYYDEVFDSSESNNAILLSDKIITILKKYQ